MKQVNEVNDSKSMESVKVAEPAGSAIESSNANEHPMPITTTTQGHISTHQEWCMLFGTDALEWAGRKFLSSPKQPTQDTETTKRKLAEAAMAIGRAVIRDMDDLCDAEGVNANRDVIIASLADYVGTGDEGNEEFWPPLAEAFVDTVARALGEMEGGHMLHD